MNSVCIMFLVYKNRCLFRVNIQGTNCTNLQDVLLLYGGQNTSSMLSTAVINVYAYKITRLTREIKRL